MVSENQINHIHNAFNNFRLNLKVTIETDFNIINFLDPTDINKT